METTEKKLYSIKEASEILGKTVKNINNLLSYHPEIPRVRMKCLTGNKGGPLRNYLDEDSIELIKNINRRNNALKNPNFINKKGCVHKKHEKIDDCAHGIGRHKYKKKSLSSYWKVSVFDESSGHFIIRHCSLSYDDAKLMQDKYIDEDKICRISPH